jgi:hypothetical protein
MTIRTCVAAVVMLTVSVMTPSLAAASGAVVNQFKTDLGSFTEINWDGVPDGQAAPNLLPGNFFNSSGILLSTPGTGFQVSADSTFPLLVEFNNINPTYSTNFAPFSPERLFTPIGSNIVDVQFVVPGTSTPVLTNGFGAIFSDVDLANTTSIAFFDASNASLGTFFVPAGGTANESFSFLGVTVPTAVVSRVRIIAGNAALGTLTSETSTIDLVVLDNIIFGAAAPAVPEPGSLMLLAIGLAGAVSAAWRRRG